MPRGTTLRNVRVSDEVWNAAKEKAEADGRNLSEVIRTYLERYAKRK